MVVVCVRACVRVFVCVCGGGGASQGPKVHWTAVKVSPKILCGFQDSSLQRVLPQKPIKLQFLQKMTRERNILNLNFNIASLLLLFETCRF